MVGQDTLFQPNHTLNIKGKVFQIDSPMVMGILNVTPDSFFDGGRYHTPVFALQQIEKMVHDGAHIIDVGGLSTRPGATEISVEEEIERVVPIIVHIAKQFPHQLISIDTYRSQVAEAALVAGAHIINDVSAGEMDAAIVTIAAKYKAPYCMMHMQGNPRTMQQNPTYTDVVLEVFDYFVQKIAWARAAGVVDIIIDPGFGFGKTILHNYELVKKLSVFKQLGYPLLAGVSRKSMLYRLLGITPQEALPATSAINLQLLMNSAKILRVHDVKEAVDIVELYKQLK